MKTYAEQFYKSITWQNCRNAYIKKVGGLCEECLKCGKIAPAEEVHHKIVLNESNISDPNISLNEENLIALCRSCHRKAHGNQKRYTIDEQGRVRPR